MDKYKKAFDNMRVSPEILERAKKEAAKVEAGGAGTPVAEGPLSGAGVEMNKVRSMESARNRRRSYWTLGAAAACFVLVVGVWVTGGLPALDTPVGEEIGNIKDILSVEEEPENVYLEMTESGEAIVTSVEPGGEVTAETGKKTPANGTDPARPGKTRTEGTGNVFAEGSVKTGTNTGTGENDGRNGTFSAPAAYGNTSGVTGKEDDDGDSHVVSEGIEGIVPDGKQGEDQNTGSSEGTMVMTAPASPGTEPTGNSENGLQTGTTSGVYSVQDLKTVEDAASVLGFKPKVPEGIPSGYKISSINVIGGNMLSVTYVKGPVKVEYRYERTSADISGDYTNYGYSEDLVTGSKKYVLKGNSAEDIRCITYVGGSESCSYSFDAPVSTGTAINWISALG